MQKRIACSSLRKARKESQILATVTNKRPAAVAVAEAQKRKKVASTIRAPLATKNSLNIKSEPVLASKPKEIVSGSSAPLKQLRLPSFLPHPVLLEVNPSNYSSAYPELARVPPEYIRERLPLKGTEMLAAVSCTQPSTPLSSLLPRELQVVMSESIAPSARPTHMLAVYSNAPSSGRRKVTMFASHQLVLAAHCSRLPALPMSSSPSNSKLPVVPLCLPSPELFPLLQTYLYVKRPDILYNALVPPSLVSAAPSEARFVALTRQTVAIHGLWKNACALGVVEEVLYDIIDRAWSTVVSLLRVNCAPTVNSCSLSSPSTPISAPVTVA